MDGALTMSLPNEQALVARAAADPAAFAALYDHYFPRVYNYARYRVQDGEAAGDLTAQIFEQALRALDGYDPDRGAFAAWLFGIARNAINLHFRARKRHRWLSLDALRGRAGNEPNPEKVVISHEMQHSLLQAVANLRERERELIALKFGAGLTNRHIAELTGMSEGNVGVTLYRAVQRLRRELVEME